MDPTRYAQVKALLAEALEHPVGARAAFLEHACGGDAELLGEVGSLLAAAEGPSDLDRLLEEPAPPVAVGPAPDPTPTGAPARRVRSAGRRRGWVLGLGASGVALLALSLGLRATGREAARVERERVAAQGRADRAAIAAAEAALGSGAREAARARLAEVPPERRRWEWRHLAARLDPGPGSPASPSTPTEAGGPSADGAAPRSDGPRVLEHPHGVRTVDPLPDGTLLSSDRRGLFRRWDPATGERLDERQLVPARSRLARSDDGQVLARARWQTLVLLDAALEERATLDLDRTLTDVALSGDGRVVAARDSHAIHVRSLPDLVPLLEVSIPERLPPGERVRPHRDRALHLARDGTRLVTQAGALDLVVWELPSGRELHRLAGPTDAVTALAASPDGRLLAAGEASGAIRVWDLAARTVVAVLEGHTAAVLALAWTADGTRLASGSEDATVRLWDPAGGPEVLRLTGHADAVGDLAFLADDGRLVSASDDGTLRVWDARPRPGW